MVIMPSGVPADLGAGASLGDLSVGDAGLVALRFAGFFAAGAGSARAAVFWRLLLPSGAIPVHGQMLCRNAGTWLPGVWSNPFCLPAEPSCHG